MKTIKKKMMAAAVIFGITVLAVGCKTEDQSSGIHLSESHIVIDESVDEDKINIEETEISQERILDDSYLESSDDAEADAKLRETLERLTLEEKVAQMFIITPESLTGYGTVIAAGDSTREAINTYPVGGIIYMGPNIENPKQVKEMLSNTQRFSIERNGIPMFLCIDEEGGQVARIGEKADVFGVEKIGNMCDIGATGDLESAKDVGETIGVYLSKLGFNLDFAPDADVLTNPNNMVVKYRSFGSDPQVVSTMAQAMLTGLQNQNVLGVLKHYPGHGATVGDTHEGYAYTDKTLEELMENELIPFIDGNKNSVNMIMAAHIACPEVTGDQTPTSMSERMITDILREEIGYQGVVITDAMNMGAIQNHYTSAEASVAAIKAGVDIVLMPADFKAAYAGVIDAVQKGDISEERINQSVYRILSVKRQIEVTSSLDKD